MTMKKLMVVAVVLFVLSILGCADVKAEGSVPFEGAYPEFTIGVDYVSQYVWRGQLVNDDGLQPWVSIDYKNWYFNAWGNMTGINGKGDTEFNEYDFLFYYHNKLVNGVDYKVGMMNCVYPNTKYRHNAEWFAGLMFDAPLNPTITVHKGTKIIYGTYVDASVSHTIEQAIGTLDYSLPLNFFASLGWADAKYNSAYFGVDESGMNDLVIKVSTDIPMGEWTLSPNISYIKMLDNSICNSVDDNDFIVTGVSLVKKF